MSIVSVCWWSGDHHHPKTNEDAQLAQRPPQVHCMLRMLELVDINELRGNNFYSNCERPEARKNRSAEDRARGRTAPPNTRTAVRSKN